MISRQSMLCFVLFLFLLSGVTGQDAPAASSPSATLTSLDAAPTASTSRDTILRTVSNPTASFVSGAFSSSASLSTGAQPTYTTQPTYSSMKTPTSTHKPQHTLQAKVSDIDTLPLRPRITPAFALTGIIFIVSGLAFTLIGLRSQKLHVFLSSAYLVALAITVLVVYVAEPPISDGVQGAYFVAALLSGCIIGGLSLIFIEVTEGLGCLLGGFCLSMWLMVLRPGGLIQDTGGRIGFIAALSSLAFAFTFSRYTRTYAMLVCIAFAGAFIVVIGIDCFSRAGLKEFLVYVWDLNDELFPLDTNTYPLTRGIKVEIAAVIIIFLCGVLAQLKLYRIFKERLDKTTARRAQDAEDREHLEADLGKRIEDTNMRERELWERKYHEFDKGHVSAAASAVGSVYAPSTASRAQSVKDMTMSVREVTSPDIDMMEMRTINPQANRDEKSESLASVTALPVDQMRYTGSFRGLERIVEDASRASSPQPVLSQAHAFRHMSLRPSAPPPPAVIPMPFTVSEQELEYDHDSRSQATMAETSAVHKAARSPKRTSIARSTTVDDYASDTELESGPDIPHIDDDRASSLAATADNMTDYGDNDLPAVTSRSTSPTRQPLVKTKSLRQTPLRRVGSASDLESPPSLPDSAVSGLTLKRRVSDPAPTALVELIVEGPRDIAAKAPWTVLALGTGQQRSRDASTANLGVSTSSRAPSRTSSSGIVSFAEVGNEKPLSKLALKYRTHEWTKFLEDAEEPELGDVQPTEGGVQVQRQLSMQERVAPLDVKDPSRCGTPLAFRSDSINSKNPYYSLRRQTSGEVQPQASDAQQVRTREPVRSVSGPNDVRDKSKPLSVTVPDARLRRSTSQPIVQTKGLRHTFMPLPTQPLTESPMEHDSSSSLPNASSPIQGSTLLGLRETMMRRKTTMVTNSSSNRPHSSLLHNTPVTNGANPSTASHTKRNHYSSYGPYHGQASAYTATLHQADVDNISLSSRRAMLEQDNMPLSRRKTLMQQNKVKRTSTTSQQHSWSAAPSQLAPQQQQQHHFPQHHAPPSTQTPHQNYSHIIYDAHLPHRGPSVDQFTRQARLATFRESLRKEVGPSAHAVHANGIHANGVHAHATAEEGHRFAMLNEKRQAQAMQEQLRFERDTLESVVDQRMRNGDMIGLHRDLLRRMQLQAG